MITPCIFNILLCRQQNLLCSIKKIIRPPISRVHDMCEKHAKLKKWLEFVVGFLMSKLPITEERHKC